MMLFELRLTTTNSGPFGDSPSLQSEKPEIDIGISAPVAGLQRGLSSYV
jgi:hypothetical protein